jgi:hypothetical protein
MPEKDEAKRIVCRSVVDFERVYLPGTFERKERERLLRQPGGFQIHLERELIRCLRKGTPRKMKKER